MAPDPTSALTDRLRMLEARVARVEDGLSINVRIIKTRDMTLQLMAVAAVIILTVIAMKGMSRELSPA